MDIQNYTTTLYILYLQIYTKFTTKQNFRKNCYTFLKNFLKFPTEQTIIILLLTTLSLSFELNNPTKLKTYETISYNGSDQILPYRNKKQRATKTKLCSTHSNESSSFPITFTCTKCCTLSNSMPYIVFPRCVFFFYFTTKLRAHSFKWVDRRIFSRIVFLERTMMKIASSRRRISRRQSSVSRHCTAPHDISAVALLSSSRFAL